MLYFFVIPILALFTSQIGANTTQIFEEKLVSEINQDLMKIQQRNEEVQLFDTVAQVSGIFVAIIGGFFTTKILSISTERNRLSRQLNQLDPTIRTKDELIIHHQNIVDRISITWAEWEIDYFKENLLRSEEIKDYSEDEIIEKFYEYKQEKEIVPNEYEIAILEDQYNTISQEIKTEIQNRKNPFRIDSSLISSLLSPISRPNLVDQYSEAIEKSKIESFEKNQLVSQRKQIEDSISDIVLPESANRGIAVLFAALLIGIVNPLIFSTRIDYFGPSAGVIGITSFLGCVIIMLLYFGRELKNDLQKLIKT